MKRIVWIALFSLALATPAIARSETQEPSESHEEHESEYVRTPPAPYAQWLVDQTVASNAQVMALEMAVEVQDVCRTIAATDEEDIGERCGSDEKGSMKSSKPAVEEPSKSDPAYEITFPLHDVQQKVIGSLGMELEPEGLDRDGAVKVARGVLKEIEAKIPSKDQLFEPAPREKK